MLSKVNGEAVARVEAHPMVVETLLCVGIFHVRVVKAGDLYGQDDSLLHTGEPLVEFFDRRHTKGFAARGQFVTRYYVSDFANNARSHSVHGLSLHDGIPSWALTGGQYVEALAFVLLALVGR